MLGRAPIGARERESLLSPNRRGGGLAASGADGARERAGLAASGASRGGRESLLSPNLRGGSILERHGGGLAPPCRAARTCVGDARERESLRLLSPNRRDRAVRASVAAAASARLPSIEERHGRDSRATRDLLPLPGLPPLRFATGVMKRDPIGEPLLPLLPLPALRFATGVMAVPCRRFGTAPMYKHGCPGDSKMSKTFTKSSMLSGT